MIRDKRGCLTRLRGAVRDGSGAHSGRVAGCLSRSGVGVVTGEGTGRALLARQGMSHPGVAFDGRAGAPVRLLRRERDRRRRHDAGRRAVRAEHRAGGGMFRPDGSLCGKTGERDRKLFAAAKDAAARARSQPPVAEELLWLIERFAARSEINGRTSYTSLVKIFPQQCAVIEGRVVVLVQTGGDVIQNPSDLDATDDGHKPG